MSSRHSEVSATEKGDATSRYTTNREPSKTDGNTEFNDEDDKTTHKAIEEDDVKAEAELPVPDVDPDILEIIQTMKKERNKIRKLVHGNKLMIADLIAFEDKLDDIVGVEMTSLVEYISTSHVKTKDKY